MIKRKWLNRAEVKNILDKDVFINYREDDFFVGYVSLIKLNKVLETVIVNMCGKDRCVLKNGHSWVQWLPKGENYSIIAIYDENKYLIEWYVDILLEQGTESNSMPYYDDLFLDIVIFRDASITFMDEDELLEALNKGEINKDQYNLAYSKGYDIIKRFKNNIEEEVQYANNMLNYIAKHNDIG